MTRKWLGTLSLDWRPYGRHHRVGSAVTNKAAMQSIAQKQSEITFK
ncbi:MAG: hypothetical protein IKB19_02540 [Rikenellaceae bacterium]|nr:hypothetical protein [Rikenellaceae bacterium]